MAEINEYNPAEVDSIYDYALKLKNHSLKEVITFPIDFSPETSEKTKGKFGQFLEKYYFGLSNNSNSEPDFKEAGVELKSTPLKKLRDGSLTPKERLVLNIINYETIVNEQWENSHFLSKNEVLLLIFYLYETDKMFLDYLIKHVSLYKIQGEDREIIRQDWEKIVEKVRSGHAHELSEGDTFYLGACRKGHHEEAKHYTSGSIVAKQRAFSFKVSFMKTILEKIKDTEPLVKNPSDLKKKNFETIVAEKFNPFLGMEITQIERKLGINLNHDAKSFYASLARRMMGVTAKKIDEFEKADVQLKIIRLKHNGVPKEDMSFPKFNFIELSNQSWEDSDFYSQLEKKFFFIVYQMNKDETKIIFKKAFFWNMPSSDLQEAQRVWLETKNIINKGIKTWPKNGKNCNNLPNKSGSYVSHVRPHGKNKDDVELLPDGQSMTKSCFWLNAKYLQKQIEKN